MNIENYANNLELTESAKGFSFLAHRVPTSEEAPYRIAVSEPIQPNTPIVLILGGSGGGTNIEGHNGLLKTVDGFIRSNPTLNKAQVHIAICNFGTDYQDQLARTAFIIEKEQPILWKIMKKHTKHPLTNMSLKHYMPKAVLDIYDSVILPKIATKDGHRLPMETLLKNLREVTIVAYCAGGHTAMKLEEIIQQEMLGLGYTQQETIQALKQITIIGYAITCPYEHSNMKFFTFASISDNNDLIEPNFKQTIFLLQKDVGCIHFSKNNSDTFYCTQISKTGIEGNSNIAEALRIEDYLEKQKQQSDENHKESETDLFNEHTFIGFVPKIKYSNGAKQLQKMFAQIVKQTTLNSINNSTQNEFMPLPSINKLLEDPQLLQQADKNYKSINMLYQCIKAPFYIAHELHTQIMLRAIHTNIK